MSVIANPLHHRMISDIWENYCEQRKPAAMNGQDDAARLVLSMFATGVVTAEELWSALQRNGESASATDGAAV